MENQLFSCLFTDLFGPGKQFFPKGQVALSGEGQNAFFSILAEKMSGTENMPFFVMPSDAAVDSEAGVPRGEDEDTGKGPFAAGLDPGEIALIVSSLLSSRELSLVVDEAFENKNTGTPDIIGFLRDVLDILSDGDQIELASEDGTETPAVLHEEEDPGAMDRAEEGSRFMGQLSSIIHQLNRLAAQSDKKEAGQSQPDAATPGMEIPELAVETKGPEQPYPAADQSKDAGQAVVNGSREAPVFVVEVIKAAKTTRVQDVPPDKESGQQAGVQAPVVEEAKDPKDDLLIVPVRKDAVDDGAGEPKKVVIRVSDAGKTGSGDRQDGGVAAHYDNSRHSVQNASEAKTAVKNDFGAMMVDKIEKITEQFAGRNVNMDMVMRLKIDEKETLLVGFKEDGNRINVELKTSNENMMNFLHSQKEDIVKNLEGKNIHTSIHIDLNQDGYGRHDRKDDRADRDGDEQDNQEFSAFVEALS